MDSRLVNSDSTSGLDLTLLGLIALIVGWYGRSMSVPATTKPDLIRFFSVSPDRTYPAVMPQDKALLLLNDPATGQAAADTATAGVGSLNGVWTLVAFLGLLLLVAGPALMWANRS